MEKKRVLVIALCLILMTVVISSAASTFNVNTVARLNISGTTASCMGNVVADKTTDSISATKRLKIHIQDQEHWVHIRYILNS